MATQHSRVYGHPVHAREPSANISSEEELLETMSADSDSSTDALGMSEHMEVQGMLRRADWLHEQSERQAQALLKLADDYEATLERVRSQRSSCRETTYPDFHIVSPAFPTPSHLKTHSPDPYPARPSTPPETPPQRTKSPLAKAYLAGPTSRIFSDSPFATHDASPNRASPANVPNQCHSPTSTESSYQRFRSPGTSQAVRDTFLGKESAVQPHDKAALLVALQEIQDLRKQLAEASAAPVASQSTAVQCGSSPKASPVTAAAPAAPPRAPPPPPPPLPRNSTAKAPLPPPLPPRGPSPALPSPPPPQTSAGSSRGPSRAPTPPPPPLPKHGNAPRLACKVRVDAHTRAFCQALRPPDAAPEDAFDYRKAHWERSRAPHLGVWDSATAAELEGEVVNDRLLSLAFARVKAKPSKRVGSASGAEAGSPRTPTRLSSMSLQDCGSGVLSYSSSMQRIQLLGKSESQNIEIQLKGIKLHVSAIVKGIDMLDASRFKQNEVDFIRKISESEDQYACMEEAALPHGGLEEIAERLAVAETFMYRLWGVPRFREKLAVLQFWHSYHDDWSYTKDLLGCLRSAIAEVRASSALHRFLSIIRYIGNRLNMQGTLDCDALHSPEVIRAAMARYAAALKINDKLFQVMDTKTYHPQGSKLIHFVVAMCERGSPDVLRVGESLPHLQRASKHTFENAIVPFERLKVGLEALEEEFSMQPLPSPSQSCCLLTMSPTMELPCTSSAPGELDDHCEETLQGCPPKAAATVAAEVAVLNRTAKTSDIGQARTTNVEAAVQSSTSVAVAEGSSEACGTLDPVRDAEQAAVAGAFHAPPVLSRADAACRADYPAVSSPTWAQASTTKADAACNNGCGRACPGVSDSVTALDPVNQTLSHAVCSPSDMLRRGPASDPALPSPAQELCQDVVAQSTLSSPLPGCGMPAPSCTPREGTAGDRPGLAAGTPAAHDASSCPLGRGGMCSPTGAVANVSDRNGCQPVAAAAASGGDCQAVSPAAASSHGCRPNLSVAALTGSTNPASGGDLLQPNECNHTDQLTEVALDNSDMFADIFGDCSGMQEARRAEAEQSVIAEAKPPLPSVPLRKTLATRLDMIRTFGKRKGGPSSAAREVEERLAQRDSALQAGSMRRAAPKEVLVDLCGVVWPPMPMPAGSTSTKLKESSNGSSSSSIACTHMDSRGSASTAERQSSELCNGAPAHAAGAGSCLSYESESSRKAAQDVANAREGPEEAASADTQPLTFSCTSHSRTGIQDREVAEATTGLPPPPKLHVVKVPLLAGADQSGTCSPSSSTWGSDLTAAMPAQLRNSILKSRSPASPGSPGRPEATSAQQQFCSSGARSPNSPGCAPHIANTPGVTPAQRQCPFSRAWSPGSPGSPGRPEPSGVSQPAHSPEPCTPWLQESCASCPGWSPATPSPATAALAVVCEEESTASCAPCLVLSPPFATGASPAGSDWDGSTGPAATIDGGCSAPPLIGLDSPASIGTDGESNASGDARCHPAPASGSTNCVASSDRHQAGQSVSSRLGERAVDVLGAQPSGQLHGLCEASAATKLAQDRIPSTDSPQAAEADKIGSNGCEQSASGGVSSGNAAHDVLMPTECGAGTPQNTSTAHPGGATEPVPGVAPLQVEASVEIPSVASQQSSECSTPVGPPATSQQHPWPGRAAQRHPLSLPVCHGSPDCCNATSASRLHTSATAQSAELLRKPSAALERVVSCDTTSALANAPSLASIKPLDTAAATLALPLGEFLERARREVAELDAELAAVMAEFRELLLFFAQPVATEGAMRGVEPENFFGHIWRLVERLEAAAKERPKVEECLCLSGAGESAVCSD